MPMFKKIYYTLIDLLQLSQFLEIFDEIEEVEIFEFILKD